MALFKKNHQEVKQQDDNGLALEIKDLTIQYEVDGDIIQAVNGVSLSVAHGKTLGLVGETGAGKTTTALSILKMVPDPPGVIKSGSIKVCGKDIMAAGKKELSQIRGKDVAMIFQDPMTSLNPVVTVGDQIQESIRMHDPSISKAASYEQAMKMLELVGIPRERAMEYPHQFSGGMKQRVVIAIALCCNPKLLLADEPTTALDVTIQAQVLDMMRKLRDAYHMAMILITHDFGIVAEICDEVAVMYAGRIVERGTLDDVFNHTKHPYTEGLFNSLPNVNDRKAELIPIPGLMPDPSQLPKGCAFAERCAYATPLCFENQPEERAFSDSHCCRCLRYDDLEFHIRRNSDHG